MAEREKKIKKVLDKPNGKCYNKYSKGKELILMPKDFDAVLCMLSKAGMDFYVAEVEGEHPCVNVPSPSPDYYSTGVTYSFNSDGSLYSVHAYEPDWDEE